MEQVHQQPSRPDGRAAALGWAVFVLIAMLAAAAMIAGTIRAGLSPAEPSGGGALPSLSGPPSPAPTPLPKPGPAPPRTDRAAHSRLGD